MIAFLNTVVNVIAPILLIVLMGAAYGRMVNPDPAVLSNMIIYVFSPFLVLEGVLNAELSGELGRLMLAVIVLTAVLAVVGIAVTRGARLDQRMSSAVVLALVAINAGNYGIAFNEFAYGLESRPYAVMFYVMTAVTANTFGVFFASRGTVTRREAVVNIFRVPLVYSLLLGLLLNLTRTPLPLPLARTVALMADATIPAMLIVLGFQLARASVRGKIGWVLIASGGRLVLAPVIAVALVALFGLTGMAAKVTITSAAMPTAVIAGVLAGKFGGDSEFVTGAIVTSTLLSVVTLGILVTLIGA